MVSFQVALVEVERLWDRFKEFGLNENGCLPKKVFYKHELSKDPIFRNVRYLGAYMILYFTVVF
jgi:hypothetical protein